MMEKEKRLINANRLWRYAWNELQKANKQHEGEPDFKAWSSGVAEVIVALAKDMPTVDAVEVVRCKDCKNYQETIGKDSGKPCGYGSCTSPCWVTSIVYDEDFCSYGERKRNAE